MPSAAKNELLCSTKDDIESEVGTIENFPIRAMDFDATNKILYTGDEMGNMHKWDLSRLIGKLTDFDAKMEADKHSGFGISEFKETLHQFERIYSFDDDKKENKTKTKDTKYYEDKSNTFLTTSKVECKEDEQNKEDKDNLEKDVFLINRWKAHTDGVTWVTFNENPTFIVTSSFDKNVYIWNEKCK